LVFIYSFQIVPSGRIPYTLPGAAGRGSTPDVRSDNIPGRKPDISRASIRSLDALCSFSLASAKFRPFRPGFWD
jgi:hypothetical protein